MLSELVLALSASTFIERQIAYHNLHKIVIEKEMIKELYKEIRPNHPSLRGIENDYFYRYYDYDPELRKILEKELINKVITREQFLQRLK